MYMYIDLDTHTTHIAIHLFLQGKRLKYNSGA